MTREEWGRSWKSWLRGTLHGVSDWSTSGWRRRDSDLPLYSARPGNVLRAAAGRPPKRRPVREITAGLPYHFHHTGFDHRELRRTLSETFEVERQFASPVGGELLGTEIYLVLRKRTEGFRQ